MPVLWSGPHFAILISRGYRGILKSGKTIDIRRLALVERASLESIVDKIDARSKSIKCVYKIHEYDWMTVRGGRALHFTKVKLILLAEKLEKMWPMTWAAKELNQKPIHFSSILSKRNKRFIINITPKLHFKAQQWLERKGQEWDLKHAKSKQKRRKKDVSDKRYGRRRQARKSAQWA